MILEGQDIVDTFNTAANSDRQVVLNFSRGDRSSDIGVICRILQYWAVNPQIMGASLEGIRRVKISRLYKEGIIQKAEVLELIPEKQSQSTMLEALARSVFHQFNRLVKIEGTLSAETASVLQDQSLPPEKMSDIISSAMKMEFEDKIHLLETLDLQQRLDFLNEKLAKEINIAQTEETIQKKVSDEVNKAQREFILRERLKAIERELGDTEGLGEYAELEDKLKHAGMSQDVLDQALKELERLRRMPAVSPEAPYISTYLELLSDLPWSKKSESKIDIHKAEQVLDHDHYGLDKVKQRILEYLAVQKLTGNHAHGSILCFIGPPGTGKTSVGQSIARALGRSFARMSLGGIRDESEIRGHRRTYVGAMPGRIIEGIRRAGTKNPVFMLDEIDKVGADYRGDPASALLEVLDPAQNNSFTDHYLDVPFDLSDVFFITTANIADTIPAPLLDRMELIEFSGYTNEEKFQIAKKYLLPRVIKDTGLENTGFLLTDEAIERIASRYTREAGVRDLERKISQVARQVARSIVEKEESGNTALVISVQDLARYLGPEVFEVTVRQIKDEIGVATGLAWTPVGGEIIFIESSVIPGRRALTLTGQLGDIMKESAKAALTYVRSQSKKLAFDPKFYQDSDVHIHVPAGSVPKDGSSAGVAIAVALASTLSGRKVRKEIAFTGEITLRGKVLPVGGIKEKIIASYRAGVEKVVMPKANEKDLVDVPEEARLKIDFMLIENADEAIDVALK
jgi:ATP-dependent Lon protease